MRLAHWGALLTLILVPLLHRWWTHRNRPARIRFPLALPAAVKRGNPARVLMLLRYLALVALVFALARPQASFRQTERVVSGIDVMLVMDVSASMNIEDLSERSRLDHAKEVMENFVKGRQNDRIGMVVFSGEPVTLAPPTLDYGLVLKSIRDVATGVLKDGTGIGDGLGLAVNRLRQSRARSRVIILLTDGDNNVGQIDPMTAGELAAGYGIRVYTIAIGREGRVRMPIRQQGAFGNVITTYQWFENALNPELLRKIAERTHGKFYRVTDADTLEKVFQEIDRFEKSEVKQNEKVRYEERFQQPLGYALILLGLELALGRFLWRVLP